MSSTLVHPLPRLDHRQDFGPDGRYLPPPVNTNFYSNIPARPSSNLSNSHFAPPPPRTQSGMSNGSYTQSHTHGHSQARGGAEGSYTAGLAHQNSHEAVRRTNSAASQHQRGLPPPPQESAAPRLPQSDRLQNSTYLDDRRDDSMERGRKRGRHSPVDWVSYFGGKPPPEIITIHDDDSPVPADNSRRPPPTTNGSSTARHADKRRRTNAAGTEATYSNTNTPYSYSNHTSTESLQNTTAPTSLGSQASSGSRLDTTQTGQKRKRTTTRASDQNQSRQEPESRGPKGYLAEYGEYKPPPKQLKKQKEVHVPSIHERHPTREKIDDEDGHYIVQENSKLGERYSLVQLLGQGTFGKVVKALDIRTRKEVAVKIIRAVPKYRDASRIELRVLQTLKQADEENRNRCIQLQHCFDWRGHICIVTPLLGLSVFDFLKNGGFVPFPGSHIQAFARQLLGSIAFLHDLNLIHTDLKPENILLLNHNYQTFTYNRNIPSSSTLNPRSAKFRRVLLSPHINLIDFGSATFDDEYHSSVVSTRHYRAPEIILGIGWSHPIDLWSLGCILVECWTGDALFQTHDCCEHLAMMEAVTGERIDKHLIREVRRTSKRNDKNSAARFFKSDTLNYPLPDTPRQSRKFVRSMKKLEEIIPQTTPFNRQFLDLLRKIFVYDPKRRITARQALAHPWFQELVDDDGTEAGRIRVERERVEGRRREAGR